MPELGSLEDLSQRLTRMGDTVADMYQAERKDTEQLEGELRNIRDEIAKLRLDFAALQADVQPLALFIRGMLQMMADHPMMGKMLGVPKEAIAAALGQDGA